MLLAPLEIAAPPASPPLEFELEELDSLRLAVKACVDAAAGSWELLQQLSLFPKTSLRNKLPYHR